MFQKINKYLPLICTIFFIIILILSFIRPISGTDTWFHLRIGQDIWEGKSIPQNDYHSFTNPGVTYINQSWLAQIIFFLIYKSTGILGLQILHLSIVFLSFFLLLKLNFPQKHLSILLITFILPLAITQDEIRPFIFTWFFLSLIFYLIKQKLFYLIPLIFLLWANIHSGFLIGIIVLFFYLLKEYLNTKKPTLIIIFLVSIFASCLTPYGPKIYLYPLTLGNLPETMNIAEWRPFSPNEIYFWIYITYTLSLLVLTLRKKFPHRIIELLFIITLSIIGYSSRRHSIVVSIILFPLILNQLSQLISLKTKNLFFFISPLLLIIIFFSYQMQFKVNKINQIDSTRVPVYGQKFLTDHNLSGNMFNDYNFGAYLIWKNPNQKVFIDSRQELYIGQTSTDFMNIYYTSENWEQLLDKYQINYIIVQPYCQLSLTLIDNPNWDLVYFDSSSAIFIKKNDYPNIPRLKNLTPVIPRNPANTSLTIQELKYLLNLNPEFYQAYRMLAVSYYDQNDFLQAKESLDKFILNYPEQKNTKSVVELEKLLDIYSY